MATFPTSLPTTSTIPVEAAGTTLATNHVASHQGAQNEIIAIATKVGVDGSAVTTTHDYKLGEILTTDKAVGKTATQTLTNKTLTAAKVPLGSDAVGDMRYTSNADGTQTRIPVGTDNFIMKLNGTTPGWEAEAVTVDASTTVKGIVEAATSAEVTAGTATGATGAVLAVTPDALAASTPVFNGSGLTNVGKLIGASAADSSSVTNTTEETTVATISIPGGTLGTNKAIRIRGAFTSTFTTNGIALTYRIKYGGTALWTGSVDPIGTPTISVLSIFDATLQGAGTTSSQEGSGLMISDDSTVTANTQVNMATGLAIDSSTSQNIIITVQPSSATASTTTVLSNYVVHSII